MSNLVLHRGCNLVGRDVIDMVPVPHETDSYKPVSHLSLVKTLDTISNDLLRGYEKKSESLGLHKDGSQLFGIFNFTGKNTDMGLSVGFRNSYDKSLSVGICLGANIFVCDNLAFKGEISILKKHTKGIWTMLEDLAISALYRADSKFEALEADFQTMKAIELNQNRGYELLGRLYGNDILTPRQLSRACDQWKKPDQQAFQERNLYSLYNNCTESFKQESPLTIMESHKNLHNMVMQLAA